MNTLTNEIIYGWKSNQEVVYVVGDEPVEYCREIADAQRQLNEKYLASSDHVDIVYHDKLCGFHRGHAKLSRPMKVKYNDMNIAIPATMGDRESTDYENNQEEMCFDPTNDVIFVFKDVDMHLEASPMAVQMLRNIINSNLCGLVYQHLDDDEKSIDKNKYRGKRMIVLMTSKPNMKVLLPEITPIYMPLPNKQKMTNIVIDMFKLHSERHKANPQEGFAMPTDKQIEDITICSLGLTAHATRRAIGKSIAKNTYLDDNKEVRHLKIDALAEDIEEEKALIIQGIPGLQYYNKNSFPNESLPGYELVDEFVDERLSIPPELAKKHGDIKVLKGVTLIGPPGVGKTVACMQMAAKLGRMLLVMDIGQVQSKYVGESEAQMANALRIADAMDAALLIDDIDKAGVGGGNDDNFEVGSSVATRIVQQLLTLMSARDNNIFFMFSLNRIGGIPPELIRPGRMDAIFYSEMPNAQTRIAIAKHHLDKVKMKVSNQSIFKTHFSDSKMARWSGAEIESVLVKRLAIKAMSKGKDVIDSELIKDIVENHTPFAESSDRIQKDIEKMERDCENFIHVGNIKEDPKKTKTLNIDKSGALSAFDKSVDY